MFVCAKEQQTLSVQFFLICLRALDNNFNGFVFCEFFHLFISPQICKKREDCDTAVSRVFSYMTGFSVVRRRSVPSGQWPFYCISIGFFCCPPTLRPKVRHPFRILGASRTRGMTPSIHLYYMQNRQKNNKRRWKIIFPAFSCMVQYIMLLHQCQFSSWIFTIIGLLPFLSFVWGVTILTYLNREIRRRTSVIGIFPNESSYVRLVTTYLMEYAEDWSVSRAYISHESIAAALTTAA